MTYARPTDPPTVSWSDLSAACSSLRDFERAAQGAAETGWSGWLGWFPGYGYFSACCHKAAERLAAPLCEVRVVAIGHLRRVHCEARDRLERAEKRRDRYAQRA